MSKGARRQRLRALGAAVAALAVVFAVLVGVEATAGVPNAAANPTGLSPGVYVAGDNAIDTFRVNAINPAPINTPTSGDRYGPVAIDGPARKVLVGFVPAQGSRVLQLINVATNTVTGSSAPLQLPALALAMDPTNRNVAYVLEQRGIVGRVDITGSAPVVTPISNLANFPIATSLAIAPNGQTLYAGWGDGDICGIAAINVANPNAPTSAYNCTSTSNGGTVEDVAISPDGGQLFGVINNGEGAVVSVPLIGGQPQWTKTLGNQIPDSVTVTPNGHTLYAGTVNSQTLNSSVVPLNATTGGLGPAVPIPLHAPGFNEGGLTSIGLSPDAHTLMVVGTNSDPATGGITAEVVPVTLPSSVGPAQSLAATIPDIIGFQSVAITPDQAPQAAFTANVGPAGMATVFDASSSTVAYGTVTTFRWAFGDGASATTGSPTVSHVYAASGTYSVTLVEIDSAGASVDPTVAGFGIDGPGQTPFRRGDPGARVIHPVAVPPPTTTVPTTGHTTTPTTAHTTTTGHTTTTVKSTTTTKPHQVFKPTLTLNPGLGPPGTIVTVTGKGFPPNTPFTISWSTSTGSIVVTSDGHGNLPARQLMILTPDVLGPRFAVASSTPKAQAPFLVVPSTDEPGGNDGSVLFRSESI